MEGEQGETGSGMLRRVVRGLGQLLRPKADTPIEAEQPKVSPELSTQPLLEAPDLFPSPSEMPPNRPRRRFTSSRRTISLQPSPIPSLRQLQDAKRARMLPPSPVDLVATSEQPSIVRRRHFEPSGSEPPTSPPTDPEKQPEAPRVQPMTKRQRRAARGIEDQSEQTSTEQNLERQAVREAKRARNEAWKAEQTRRRTEQEVRTVDTQDVSNRELPAFVVRHAGPPHEVIDAMYETNQKMPVTIREFPWLPQDVAIPLNLLVVHGTQQQCYVGSVLIEGTPTHALYEKYYRDEKIRRQFDKVFYGNIPGILSLGLRVGGRLEHSKTPDDIPIFNLGTESGKRVYYHLRLHPDGRPVIILVAVCDKSQQVDLFSILTTQTPKTIRQAGQL